jgi:hypothetical protein
MSFVCFRCNKVFTHKGHYNNHTKNRKTPCKLKDIYGNDAKTLQIFNNNPHKKEFLDENPQQKNQNIQHTVNGFPHGCPECTKSYTRPDNLKRHMKCKHDFQGKIKCVNGRKLIIIYSSAKKEKLLKNDEHMVLENPNILQNIFAIKKISQIENIIKTLNNMLPGNRKESCGNTTYTTNHIHNTQNIGNYINGDVKMVAFGKEDLGFVTDDIYKKFIGHGFSSVPLLIKYVHFNKKRPDFHNVFVSNMNNNLVYTYTGKTWEVSSKKGIIQQMIGESKDILIEKFGILKKDLPSSSITKFKNFIEKKDDENIVVWMENEVKLMLYNNRKLPMNQRKIMEKEFIYPN